VLPLPGSSNISNRRISSSKATTATANNSRHLASIQVKHHLANIPRKALLPANIQRKALLKANIQHKALLKANIPHKALLQANIPRRALLRRANMRINNIPVLLQPLPATVRRQVPTARLPMGNSLRLRPRHTASSRNIPPSNMGPW
jgi:hypothetical protein